MATFQVNNKSYINQIATLISLSTRPRILHAYLENAVKSFYDGAFWQKSSLQKVTNEKNKGFKQNKTKQSNKKKTKMALRLNRK